MATLDEIKSSKRANRHFWNEQISLSIAIVKANILTNSEQSNRIVSASLLAVKKQLKSRREFEFLDDNN